MNTPYLRLKNAVKDLNQRHGLYKEPRFTQHKKQGFYYVRFGGTWRITVRPDLVSMFINHAKRANSLQEFMESFSDELWNTKI